MDFPKTHGSRSTNNEWDDGGLIAGKVLTIVSADVVAAVRIQTRDLMDGWSVRRGET